ncbi:hypothetical protein AM499_04480 [Bacillus sp. FJAT-22090]|uniref:hypothetical protein n=1 Tax=Bacillus sp. FJAT-22090 TaxID=1581038 RepID=UPI0006B020E7|nr:hypothetical protein [Bacillus sp. FJAT-22090]ALC85153.1 hypothetical protein AM499_04480 [Bacillus sp. FJAT-22090]
MAYVYQLPHYISIDSFWMILELLLVTSCLSTIIFLLTKSDYVSALSAIPIFFVLSLLTNYQTTHLFFLIVALLVQVAIISTIQHETKKKVANKIEKTNKFSRETV